MSLALVDLSVAVQQKVEETIAPSVSPTGTPPFSRPKSLEITSHRRDLRTTPFRGSAGRAKVDRGIGVTAGAPALGRRTRRT